MTLHMAIITHRLSKVSGMPVVPVKGHLRCCVVKIVGNTHE